MPAGGPTAFIRDDELEAHMYHQIIHPLAGGTALCMVLSLGCAGTSVQPGQRGLMWRPFSEGLSNEPLKDGFYWRAPWNDVYLYDIR